CRVGATGGVGNQTKGGLLPTQPLQGLGRSGYGGASSIQGPIQVQQVRPRCFRAHNSGQSTSLYSQNDSGSPAPGAGRTPGPIGGPLPLPLQRGGNPPL